MAWQSNIPQPGAKLSISQGDLLGNFIALNTWMGVNHYLPTNLANGGKHMFVSLPTQSADPATAGSELAIYSKIGTGGVPQIFWRQQSNGTVTEFTGATVVTSAGPTRTQGQTVLPSGVMIKWGVVTTSSVGSSAITYQGTAFAAVSPLTYSLTMTILNASSGIVITNYGNSGFNYTNTTAVVTFFYQAIGI